MSVERDPYAFTNGECADKLEEFLQVAKERDPVGWPRGILPYIEHAVDALRNPPLRGFIADAARSPMRAPNGRNDAGEPAGSFWNRRAERAAGGVDALPHTDAVVDGLQREMSNRGFAVPVRVISEAFIAMIADSAGGV